MSPSKRSVKRGLPRSHSVSTVEGLEYKLDNCQRTKGTFQSNQEKGGQWFQWLSFLRGVFCPENLCFIFFLWKGHAFLFLCMLCQFLLRSGYCECYDVITMKITLSWGIVLILAYYWGLWLSACAFFKLRLQSMYSLCVVTEVCILLALWLASNLTNISLNVGLQKGKHRTVFLSL